MGMISAKLRASAKDKACTFQIPGICTHDNAQSVLCHLPSEVKGMGNKGDDWHAAIGCCACHEAIDHHRLSKEDELFYCLRALRRTQSYWVQSGLIFITGVEPQKPKTRPKKKYDWSKREIKSANNLRRDRRA